MQIPILNGIYTDSVADFRTSYPVNMIPVPKDQGVSKGYLRPADGIIANGTGPGLPRGSINWNGTCYRVMGTKLVTVAADGTVTILADVGGGSGRVVMDYGFDRLAIASGGFLFYWDGSTLTHVTDSDIGTVVDFCWADGYFVTTDGAYLAVTELSDPTAINPLKYGSSEADPDPINALMRLRNEVWALNRYTCEVFDNVGGEFFPFARIEGAQVQKGSMGTHCSCVYADTIAFLGSGRNESPAIYLAANATAVKISTREIDELIAAHNESTLAGVVFESRNDKGRIVLMCHLPDRTLCYDGASSAVLGDPVWYQLTTTAVDGFTQYRAIDHVWCNDRWMVTDPAGTSVGYLTDAVSSHYGAPVRWEFGTTILYAEGRGAIIYELELSCLTGRMEFGTAPEISTSYSMDGITWSQDKYLSVGSTGNRTKRIVWRQQGMLRNWRMQRFRGNSDAFLSVARLEARIEPLAF